MPKFNIPFFHNPQKPVTARMEARLTNHRITPQANERIVYMSGPHGVGKSTLIEALVTEGFQVQAQIAHLENLEDQLSRQVWRVALHALEHRENLARITTLLKENNQAALIGDRCYFDDFAYLQAFLELGWISKENVKGFMDLTSQTYTLADIPFPQKIILLLPPLSWNIERIEERWRKGEKVKWHERDYTYLAFVRDAFETMAHEQKQTILVIRSTETNQRVKEVKNWLPGNFLHGSYSKEGHQISDGWS